MSWGRILIMSGGLITGVSRLGGGLQVMLVSPCQQQQRGWSSGWCDTMHSQGSVMCHTPTQVYTTTWGPCALCSQPLLCLFLCLSISLSVSLSVCLSICLYVCHSFWLAAILYIRMLVCLSILLTVHLS